MKDKKQENSEKKSAINNFHIIKEEEEEKVKKTISPNKYNITRINNSPLYKVNKTDRNSPYTILNKTDYKTIKTIVKASHDNCISNYKTNTRPISAINRIKINQDDKIIPISDRIHLNEIKDNVGIFIINRFENI